MGQRLNIGIIDNGRRLANSYYHWSAYTSSAAELTNTVIDTYFELCDEIKNKVELAVRMLESTGAGMYAAEQTRIDENKAEAVKGGYANIKFQECHDRNRGLISVTKAGMDETEDWSEGDVAIDIGTGLISFGVIWEDTKEEYDDNCEGGFDELPEFDYDFSEVVFDDAPWLAEMCDTYPAGFRTPDGFAVHWIE